MSMIVDIPLVDSFSKDIILEGYLTIPNDTHTNSIVIFVHGSGSSKDSVRNQYLAKELNKNSITTFLFNLQKKSKNHTKHLFYIYRKEYLSLIWSEKELWMLY